MSRQIPHVALMQRPELTVEIQAAAQSQRAYDFACTFYGIKPSLPWPTSPESGSRIPFIAAFESLISLTLHCTEILIDGAEAKVLVVLREVFVQALGLVDKLVVRLENQVAVKWDPTKWLASILASLEQEVRVVLPKGLYTDCNYLDGQFYHGRLCYFIVCHIAHFKRLGTKAVH